MRSSSIANAVWWAESCNIVCYWRSYFICSTECAREILMLFWCRSSYNTQRQPNRDGLEQLKENISKYYDLTWISTQECSQYFILGRMSFLFGLYFFWLWKEHCDSTKGKTKLNFQITVWCRPCNTCCETRVDANPMMYDDSMVTEA